MIKFEDSQLPFEKTINGYYRVGKKFFYKKYGAAVESDNTMQPISWDFHRSAFECAINNPNINLNLLDLYKERAQQLRDSYDYLILAYSGGSDSDNMLKTFLYNNIKLDEIWSDFPKNLIEKSNYVLSNSTNVDNISAELYTVVIPELTEVAQKYPNIKIHFSDTWNNRTNEDYEDTYSIMNTPMNYILIQRHRYILNYAKKIIDSGKTVAIIKGIDKPIPYVKNNSYGIVFSDKATAYKSEVLDGAVVPVEYFYWSPLFPQLAIAQGKNLWNYLLIKQLTEKVKMLNTPNSVNLLSRQAGFDYVVKKICFPYWNFNKLQVDKPNPLFNKNYMSFIEKHSNDMHYQSYLSSLRSLNKISTFAQNDTLGDYKWNYCFFSLGTLPDINK